MQQSFNTWIIIAAYAAKRAKIQNYNITLLHKKFLMDTEWYHTRDTTQ